MDGVVADSEYLWQDAYLQQLTKRSRHEPQTEEYQTFKAAHYRGSRILCGICTKQSI